MNEIKIKGRNMSNLLNEVLSSVNEEIVELDEKTLSEISGGHDGVKLTSICGNGGCSEPKIDE